MYVRVRELGETNIAMVSRADECAGPVSASGRVTERDYLHPPFIPPFG